jgi:hypothetical protein
MPAWVVIAGMVVALLIAGIIMANVLGPLGNLIFPDEAKAPLPEGATLLEENPDPRLSDEERLYGVNLEGCAVAQFYIDQGSQCVFAPLACDPVTTDANGNPLSKSIATCRGTHTAVAASYSWMVDISSGYSDYRTRFRVYVFKERR